MPQIRDMLSAAFEPAPEILPRHPEAVLSSNGKSGSLARWLVKWKGHSKALATWEAGDALPAQLIDAFEEQRQAQFNLVHEPMLAEGDPSGVVPLSLSAEDASACAAYLRTEWVKGRLRLPNGQSCLGYSSYGKTLSDHDSKQQRLHTLLMTNTLLPIIRQAVPGFERLELELAHWLQQRYGTVVELFYAHGLRQSPQTLSSTGFSVHQDNEDFDFIEFTVVVKLTPDAEGEPPSAMRVVGAPRHFHYGPRPGDAGAFRARLYHASVAPASPEEHLKIAFFFRRSVQGERLAKRGLAGADGARGGVGSEQELAQRRADVHARTFVEGKTLVGGYVPPPLS